MTSVMRLVRRALLLPVDAPDNHARQLAEVDAAKASASRAMSNACASLAKRGAEIHALTACVVARNEKAK